MEKQSLSFIKRLFPKKVVSYLIVTVNNILDEDNALSDVEILNLQNYRDNLMNSKKSYLKSNLDFVRVISPLVTSGKASKEVNFLYSEIVKLNPGLLSKRLGAELVLKDVMK